MPQRQEAATARDRASRVRLARRWEAAWAATEAAGYGALLVAGRGVISQYGYLEFIAGYVPVIREAYAFLAPGREPVLVLPTQSDAEEARSRVGLEARVAGGGALVADGTDLGSVVADLLRDAEPGGAIGVVGLSSIVSAGDAQRLTSALQGHELIDATNLLNELKIRKTADDLDEMQATARIVDAGFDVLRQRIRSGSTPWELAGAVQGVVRSLGARDALVFVSSGPNTTVSVDSRPLQAGDLVSGLVELAGPTGYWVEFSGLFAIGDLDTERESLAHACLSASDAAASLLRPGTRVASVAEAIDAHAEAAGARTGIWHGHGVGVDHDLPLLGRTEQRALEPGMALAVHPNFSERHERFGAMVADTYVIEESGARRLSGIGQELRRVHT